MSAKDTAKMAFERLKKKACELQKTLGGTDKTSICYAASMEERCRQKCDPIGPSVINI